MKFEKSNKLFKKACSYFPGGVQTISKRPVNFYAKEQDVPLYFKSAKGAFLTDIDGNKYIDYILALGPVILGYNYNSVNKAIESQLKKGILTSLSSELEILLAKKINKLVLCAQSIRFMKTGAEAASAAVKISRAYTGKNIVLMCGYFGWHDWSNKDNGVPKEVKNLTHEFKFNDFNSLERLVKKYRGKIACVIMEPVVLMEPKKGYLKSVRELCSREKIVLIFDEIKTGFRISKGGAQEFYKVVPDIAVFAKAFANGMPLAAVSGKKQFMSVLGKIWISSTYACEALSFAASIATIDTIDKKNVPAYISNLGNKFHIGLAHLIVKHKISAVLSGVPAMTSFRFTGKQDKVLKMDRFFFTEALKRGVLLKRGAYNFISYSHTEKDIDYTLNVIDDVLIKLKNK